MESINKSWITFFILFFVVLNQSAIDIYIPSLPAIMHELQTTSSLVQLSISTFILGSAFSQLIFGTLSDHYGRRPIAIFGISVFILASLFCGLTHSIYLLLIGRLIEGVGIGAVGSLPRAMTRDVTTGLALARMATYLTIVWTITPIIAPIAGGYIQDYFDWRMNFYFLATVGSLTFLTILVFMPETNPASRRQPLKLNIVMHNFKFLLTNKIFMGNVITIGLLFSIFIAINVIGPFLFQVHLHLSPVQFGWTLAIISVGFLLGCISNIHLIKYYSRDRIIGWGYTIILISNSVFVFLAWNSWLNFVDTIGIMLISLFGLGFIYGNSISNCLQPFPQVAGYASSLYGFFVFGIACLSSSIDTHLPTDSRMPLSVMWLFLSIITCAIYFFVAREEPRENC